jgi:hypothetical protein
VAILVRNPQLVNGEDHIKVLPDQILLIAKAARYAQPADEAAKGMTDTR